MEDLERKKGAWSSLTKLLVMMIVLGAGIQVLLLLSSALIMNMFSLDGVANFSFTESSALVLKVFLACSTIATFILPSWILYRYEGRINAYFQRLNKITVLQYIYVFAAMLCFVPAMTWISHWNEQMQLPESLAGLQQWMRLSEDSAARLTKKIVEESTWTGMMSNLLVIAVLPAIGEEMVFRGCLQQIFGRWFSNRHVVIWFVAILFSAFHMQFFGFFPRLLLGAFFGYLYFWSKNIYLPIFGHFVNNASATISAFYYTRKGVSFEEMNAFVLEPIWVYLASFIFTAIFVVLYYYSKKTSVYGAGLEEN